MTSLTRQRRVSEGMTTVEYESATLCLISCGSMRVFVGIQSQSSLSSSGMTGNATISGLSMQDVRS
jgi:hypothetical protein